MFCKPFKICIPLLRFFLLPTGIYASTFKGHVILHQVLYNTRNALWIDENMVLFTDRFIKTGYACGADARPVSDPVTIPLYQPVLSPSSVVMGHSWWLQSFNASGSMEDTGAMGFSVTSESLIDYRSMCHSEYVNICHLENTKLILN